MVLMQILIYSAFFWVLLLFAGAFLYFVILTALFLWFSKDEETSRRIAYLTLLGEHYSFKRIILFATIATLSIAIVTIAGQSLKITRIERKLENAFDESSQLIVRSVFYNPNDSEDKRVLYQTEKTEEIKRIAGVFDFETSGSVGFCDCLGELIFELRKDDKIIISFVLHHSDRISIKWSPSGNLLMTSDSKIELKQWLDEVGIPRLLEE